MITVNVNFNPRVWVGRKDVATKNPRAQPEHMYHYHSSLAFGVLGAPFLATLSRDSIRVI